jgi:glycosyltransferase involved in cell wall biosynthesis
VLVARRQLRAALSAERPTVIHAHGLKTAALVLSVRPRAPLVLTLHNLVAGSHAGLRRWLLERVEARIVARADHVIAVSGEIARRVSTRLPAARWSQVLPVSPRPKLQESAAAVRARWGVAPGAPLVVVVARLHPQKDLATFLRAMADVHRRLGHARALVVGEGPERASLEATRERLGLCDVVIFTGQRPNPVDEMHAADVVALSSRWEGSPLAVAECLLLGRPLVTTKVGTVVEHLTDGVDARIVPVGDSGALAGALLELLQDPAAAASIGRSGLAIGQTVLDAVALVDGVEAAYSQVTRP